MKQVIKNLSAMATFTMVVCMHIYFALILLAKPAFAEEMPLSAPAKIEAPKAPTPPTAPKMAEAADDNVNIKINLKDGISIKGLKGAIDKLKELDKEGNKNKIEINEDEIKIGGEDAEKVIVGGLQKSGINAMADLLEDVLVPIVLFISAFSFGAFSIYSKNRTRREYLDTIKTLAQSGQPIPPELISGLNAGAFGKMNQMNDPSSLRGIKYIFWGAGIFLFIMCMNAGFVAGGFATVLLMMGGYHIYTSQLIQKQKAAEAAQTTVTPEIKK